MKAGWNVKDVVDREDEVDGVVLDAVFREFDNSNRRKFAKGIVGNCLNWEVDEDEVTSDVQKQIDEMQNYRLPTTCKLSALCLLH